MGLKWGDCSVYLWRSIGLCYAGVLRICFHRGKLRTGWLESQDWSQSWTNSALPWVQSALSSSRWCLKPPGGLLSRAHPHLSRGTVLIDPTKVRVFRVLGAPLSRRHPPPGGGSRWPHSALARPCCLTHLSLSWDPAAAPHPWSLRERVSPDLLRTLGSGTLPWPPRAS